MNTYLRILAYARPYRRYFPTYISYALLAIVFGLLNFTLLKPLFDVIFEQVGKDELQVYANKPDFSLRLTFIPLSFLWEIWDFSLCVYYHCNLCVSKQFICLPLRCGLSQSTGGYYPRYAGAYF